MMIKNASVAVLALSLLSARLFAAGDVLNIPDGARSAGLASASVPLTGTVDMLAANPAGLASVTNLQFSMMYARWAADYNCGNAAAAWSVDRIGTFGLSVKYLSTTFAEFSYNGMQAGDIHAESFLAAAGFGRAFGRARAGAALKYVHDRYQDFPFESVAADLGGGLDFGPAGGRYVASAGIALRNIGANILKNKEAATVSLPLTAACGAALRILPVRGHGLTVTSELDAALLVGSGLKLAVAAEYSYLSTIFLRGGYSKWINGEGAFTAGLGFRQSLDKIDSYMARYLGSLDIEINYGLIPFDRQFGQLAHCFSISFIRK